MRSSGLASFDDRAISEGYAMTTEHTVSCAICHNAFTSIMISASEQSTQGDDCANSIQCKDGKWYLSGHYGSSRFDLMLYRFKTPPPSELDPVCDDCTQCIIDSGDVEFVTDNHLSLRSSE